MNNQNPAGSRPVNWYSVAAVVCLIGEAILLSQAKPATEAPPTGQRADLVINDAVSRRGCHYLPHSG